MKKVNTPGLLLALSRHLKKLDERDPNVLECLNLVAQLQAAHQQATMPFAPENAKARGSEQEVIAYIVDRGLPKKDGIYFFNHMEGSGWKRNGKPVMNWKAVVRAWEAAGYFPSQRATANGVPDPMSEKGQRELSKLERQAARLNAEYDR